MQDRGRGMRRGAGNGRRTDDGRRRTNPRRTEGRQDSRRGREEYSESRERRRSSSYRTDGRPERDREGREREENPNQLEGRNPVLEAFRSGRSVDKLYVQKDLHEGILSTITREAREAGTIISYVPKSRLDEMSATGKHQGVIAEAAAYNYAEVADILQIAKKKGEDPFIFLLDGIEDPHNLGAIIRTANLAGAHGVIITKRRAVGLTATVAKASAGAINYTPVAKVTNLAAAMEELKKEGVWFVCADMNGTSMYDLNLTGPIGVVIGNEGEGVNRLVREACDYTAAIPMKGDIDSLNASVAAGVLAYEVVRQRTFAAKVQ